TAGAQPAWLTDWLAGETPLGVVEGRVVRHACGTPGVRASHAAGEVIFELVETGAAGFGLDPLVAVGRAGAVQSAVRFKCPPSNWQTFEFRSRIALLAEALGAASGAL